MTQPSNEIGNFTVNLTNKTLLPDVDYINDIAVEKNFSLGRSFINPPRILSDLYSLFQKENKDPLSFDVKKHLFSSEYIETNIINRKMNANELAYYNYTLLFLEKINFSEVLGITPLDKSLNVLMYLTHLSENLSNEETLSPYVDGVSDIEGNSHITIPNEEELAKAIEGMSEGVGSDGEPIKTKAGKSYGSGQNSNNSEVSKEMTKCVRDHLYDLSPSIANIYGKNKPSDVPINKKILKDIKIKAYLEESTDMGTALDLKTERNNDSNQKETVTMDSMDEVTKIRKSQMMLENFDDKLIKKEHNVITKVKPKTKKQILYMLLDDSGSMRNLKKQTYVRAVLLNRLESVVDGKSELKFALYETGRYNFSHVDSIESAKQLFTKISKRRPSGGGTYIGHVLQETIDEIVLDSKTNYHDPEIMIVCDGDDHVDPESIDFKDVKINVVILGCENINLKRVAEASGGFYTAEKLYDRI